MADSSVLTQEKLLDAVMGRTRIGSTLVAAPLDAED